MNKRARDTDKTPWLLLLLSIPGRQPALRMRSWRLLKAIGAATLRDGVHALPDRPDLRRTFTDLSKEVTEAGGGATLLEVNTTAGSFAAHFDRSEEYQTLIDRAAALAGTLTRPAARKAQSVEPLRREFEALVARDYCPGAMQARARRAMDQLQSMIARAEVKGEPHAGRGRRNLGRLDPARYRGRVWATRERPWVDRLASAWLIRRFIDPEATFRWLPRPMRRRGRLIGFDFDGAAFTHVGDKVTFEVLMQRFGLEGDAALRRLAAIIHYLDAGGLPAPDAPAVEVVLRGLRARIGDDDDRLLTEACGLFDALYAGYGAQRSKP